MAVRLLARVAPAARAWTCAARRLSSSVLVEADKLGGVPTGVHIITLNRPDKVSCVLRTPGAVCVD